MTRMFISIICLFIVSYLELWSLKYPRSRSRSRSLSRINSFRSLKMKIKKDIIFKNVQYVFENFLESLVIRKLLFGTEKSRHFSKIKKKR